MFVTFHNQYPYMYSEIQAQLKLVKYGINSQAPASPDGAGAMANSDSQVDTGRSCDMR